MRESSSEKSSELEDGSNRGRAAGARWVEDMHRAGKRRKGSSTREGSSVVAGGPDSSGEPGNIWEQQLRSRHQWFQVCRDLCMVAWRGLASSVVPEVMREPDQ